MSEQHWALILGASSGFGEATALELAAGGMNIFGVHLDRRETLPHANEVVEAIRAHGREAVFFNMNAADPDKRRDVIAQIRGQFEKSPGGRKPADSRRRAHLCHDQRRRRQSCSAIRAGVRG